MGDIEGSGMTDASDAEIVPPCRRPRYRGFTEARYVFTESHHRDWTNALVGQVLDSGLEFESRRSRLLSSWRSAESQIGGPNSTTGPAQICAAGVEDSAQRAAHRVDDKGKMGRGDLTP